MTWDLEAVKLVLVVLIAVLCLMYILVIWLQRRATGHSIEVFVERQIPFSRRAFGSGMRTRGITEHIRKELLEIEAKPNDLMEWIDVITLGLDGAWRAGHCPKAIAHALFRKQKINMARQWSKPVSGDRAIEHIRSKEKKAA